MSNSLQAAGDGFVTNTIRNYRDSSPQDEHRYKVHTPSSSSSSSASGVTTPVDDVPSLVPFPHHHTHSGGLSSASSSFTLDRLADLSLSGSISSRRRTQSTHRTPRLSLESVLVKPAPALASALPEHSSLGAFSPVNSAEQHLRCIVQQVEYSSEGDHTGAFPPATLPSITSPINRGTPKFGHRRRSTLQSFSNALPRPSHDVDDDDDSEAEQGTSNAFWPPRQRNDEADQRMLNIPTISRSPSTPPARDDRAGPFPTRPFLTERRPTVRFSLHSHSQPPSPLATVSPQFNIPTTSRQTRARTATTASETSPKRPQPRTRNDGSLLRVNSMGPSPKSHHRSVSISGGGASGLDAGLAAMVSMASSKKGLNATLAAVEHASRFRQRAVCMMCGKVGSDYPRCPRCGVCWCSRECRVSERVGAKSGKHTCHKGASQ